MYAFFQIAVNILKRDSPSKYTAIFQNDIRNILEIFFIVSNSCVKLTLKPLEHFK